MIIELSYHDLELKENDLKDNLIVSSKYQPDYISVFSYYSKLAKKISNGNFKVSCPIDYPLGVSDLQTRQTEIIYAIKNGASKVDVVAPNLYLVNRKYDKFREDIKCNLDICKNKNVEIFYMLEYRIFNHLALTKISNILQEFGIHTVYASTGYMLDDIIDNTIACMYLKNKTNIKTIINGNIWKKDQVSNIIKHKPDGIRFKNNYSISLWYDQAPNQTT